MHFSERLKLKDEYYKYLLEHEGIADDPLTVMAFMEVHNMTTLEKKLNDNTCACDICLKLWDDNKNKPDQYVKTKRGTELFFHTACLDSLARMNKQYRYTL